MNDSTPAAPYGVGRTAHPDRFTVEDTGSTTDPADLVRDDADRSGPSDFPTSSDDDAFEDEDSPSTRPAGTAVPGHR